MSTEDKLEAFIELLMSDVSLMKSTITLDTGLKALLKEIILTEIIIWEDLPTVEPMY